MKGKPRDVMRVGIVHFMAFPEVMTGGGPVEETVRRICEDDYFEAIEVTHVEDDAVRAGAAAVAREKDMAVYFGAQPMLLGRKLDLNHPDPEIRLAAVHAMSEALDEAIVWGAAGFAVLAGPDPGPEKRRTARVMLISSLKELCELSRRKGGPSVTLETFDRRPYGKNCLIGPTAEASDIAARVQPYFLNFGLMIDLSHLPLLGERPAQSVKTAGRCLKHVHVGNCVMRDATHPAYGDNHPAFGIPEGENGVEELAEFLKALLEAGYIGQDKRNVVSFEVKPFGDQTPEQTIANAKETLDAAWKKV